MIPEIYLIVSWVIVAITHLSVAIAVIFGVVLPLIVYMFRTIRRLFARPGMNNTLKNLIDDANKIPEYIFDDGGNGEQLWFVKNRPTIKIGVDRGATLFIRSNSSRTEVDVIKGRDIRTRVYYSDRVYKYAAQLIEDEKKDRIERGRETLDSVLGSKGSPKKK